MDDLFLDTAKQADKFRTAMQERNRPKVGRMARLEGQVEQLVEPAHLDIDNNLYKYFGLDVRILNHPGDRGNESRTVFV